MMEQDGFTVVTADDTNPNRIKVRDGVTTINGITQEKAQAIVQEQQERKLATGTKQNYIPGKEHKELIKRDFYMFQKRLVQKDTIEDLRKGFEEDKKRLQKSMEKTARRDKKLSSH